MDAVVAQLTESALSALKAVRARWPDRLAREYPSVLLFETGVSTPLSVDGDVVSIASIRSRVSQSHRDRGACYLGPLRETPDLVAAIIWHGSETHVWVFSPRDGSFAVGTSITP